MEIDKIYYWQETERCGQCAFGYEKGVCHYYGYMFKPGLPIAHDCWQFLTPDQWAGLQKVKLNDERCERWELLRHANHPGLPDGYRPPCEPPACCDSDDDAGDSLFG